ncbi:Tyrosine recombinase XerD [Candidatus Cyrtobacter comes]|uniref:Tyrosine recombinase XerD n=1 Tax=Candidatus Cyrtobacter comes TaxID=675776 RepID=A0ABU5L8Z1_9RICK|nr:tyrosine-type recombinase/integrase [Candidatus Cyrtobacter comes]MDZ5762589.1 Tyrosine recombinase XerD [Candidatus Cyrtobacter comes]
MERVKISAHDYNLLLLNNFREMMLSERFASQHTVVAYESDIEHFLCYIKNLNKHLKDVIFFEIEKYISSISCLHPRSISRKISAIKQFFLFLVSDGICKLNPTSGIESPKKPVSLPKALSRVSIEKLLECAKKDISESGIRTNAIIQILYSTGMRVSELLSLNLNSVQKTIVNSKEVRCTVIKGKGEKERIALLHEEACEALDSYILIRKQFINGQTSRFLFASTNKKGKATQLTRQRVGQIFKELALKTGIDPSIVSPHKIRHSFATHMLKNGANIRIVQEMLGHSDISSTQIYIKTTNKESTDLVFDKHPLSKITKLNNT